MDRLYADYWKEFDHRRLSGPARKGEDRFWHVEERQGRLVRPRIDLFMLHDLTVRAGRELHVTELFREFRSWFGASGLTSEQYLSSMHARAQDFASLIEPDGKDRVSVFARRLRSLDTSTVYPILLLLMELRRSGLSHETENNIIVSLESYLIRRFICRLTNKNYNSFFLGLLRRMIEANRQGENLAVTVQEELLRPTGSAVLWPTDEEFELGWIEEPIYVKSRSDRSGVILRALNDGLRGPKSEYLTLAADVTVEHLLPQQADEILYPYPEPDVLPLGRDLSLDARRVRMRDTIGNLTLLTQSLNSSLSNGPFPTKAKAIGEDSDLRLNAMFRNTDKLAAVWDERYIAARGQALFEIAKTIWPRPVVNR